MFNFDQIWGRGSIIFLHGAKENSRRTKQEDSIVMERRQSRDTSRRLPFFPVAAAPTREYMPTSSSLGNMVPVKFELTSIAIRLDDLLNCLDDSVDALPLDTLPLKTIISSLVKMYALIIRQTRRATSPSSVDLTETELVTLACAILRARGLDPFDLAISFSLGEPPPRMADFERKKRSDTTESEGT
jgi:hypothetical protein